MLLSIVNPAAHHRKVETLPLTQGIVIPRGYQTYELCNDISLDTATQMDKDCHCRGVTLINLAPRATKFIEQILCGIVQMTGTYRIITLDRFGRLFECVNQEIKLGRIALVLLTARRLVLNVSRFLDGASQSDAEEVATTNRGQ